MYIKLAHIKIEQGLQEIGVFAYADMLHEELDLIINSELLAQLEDSFNPLRKSKHPYEYGQSILDKFQNLQVKGVLLDSPTLVDDAYTSPLPTNYVHLIADVSITLEEDNMSAIIPGAIIVGEYYKVKGQKTVIYNGQNYNTGSIFIGVNNVTGYTYSGSGTLYLIKLKKRRSPNRLQFEDFVDQVKDNYLAQTSPKSPISSVSGGQLYAYTNGFVIVQFLITYVRQPRTANFNFTQYTVDDNLVLGQKYESIDTATTYNGVLYQPFTPFTVVAGHTTVEGAGHIRLYQDGDIELSDTMANDLIGKVIQKIQIITGADQQKIVNEQQEGD